MVNKGVSVSAALGHRWCPAATTRGLVRPAAPQRRLGHRVPRPQRNHAIDELIARRGPNSTRRTPTPDFK